MDRRGSRRKSKPAGRAPDSASLREAALSHLARFAATEAGLRRVLERRVDQWARRAGQEDPSRREAITADAAQARLAAAEVARALVAAGAVDDATFAAARARRLARAGRSRRAIAANLATKGVAAAIVEAALPDGPEAEFDAAIAFCRRRRVGPFARDAMDAAARLKALGALARAGFSRDIATRAMALTPEDAEERLLASRRA